MRVWLVLGLAALGSLAPRATARMQRELPRELFNGLSEATVEGWIRFDSLAAYSRFFDVGRSQNSINITHYERSPNLLFEVWADATNRAGLHVLGLLRTNEWCHLAAVVGPHGQRLYFNGLLVASNSVTIAFDQLRPGGQARLGRSTWGQDSLNLPLNGALAEVRLWSRERTADEIQAHLHVSLAGQVGRPDAPPGLIQVWGEDFLRRPSETDVDRELPGADELAHPGILEAVVTDEQNQPVNLAEVRIRTVHQRTLVAGRTGDAGYYRHTDIAGAGIFRAAIHDARSQLVIEVFSPRGAVTVRQPSVAPGSRRTLAIRLPQAGASKETTNYFVRELVRDLAAPQAWLREFAALDLGSLGDFPNAAAALASTYALDADPEVRQQLSYTLNDLSYRSPIAVAALLETPGTADWLRPEAIQAALRQRPVPTALRTVYARRTQAVAFLFAGILGAFTALHLFVYWFDSRNRTDGLYALFTGVGALGTLLNEQGHLNTFLISRWLGPACLALALSLALRLLYALFAPRIPKRFWVLNALFCLSGVKAMMSASSGSGQQGWQGRALVAFILLVALAVTIEMLRVTWQAYRAGKPGSRLVGGGLVVFALGQLLAPFSLPIFFDDVWAAWLFPLSMTVFVVSASMFLAREFVRTNRALRQAHADIECSQLKLTTEIGEAAAYVRSLLPTPWQDPDVTTAWAFQPSTQLGGDAFGHHRLDADRSAFYLLDACGHGVGAALLSVSALNLLRAQSLAETDFGNPADVMHELNRRFPMEAHGGQFFTAWYGVYDRRDRSLTYASAGHPPAYVLASGQQPLGLRTPGSPIGCFPHARYQNAQTTLPVGARLLLISDGVYELQNPGGSPLTLRDFEEALARHRWPDPLAILAWARRVHGQEALEDDFSVLQAQMA